MEICEFWETDEHRIGESGWYEAFTENVGELFRSCQREFGRCTGKVYIDVAVAFSPSITRQVGWIFEKLKVRTWVIWRQGGESDG